MKSKNQKFKVGELVKWYLLYADLIVKNSGYGTVIEKKRNKLLKSTSYSVYAPSNPEDKVLFCNESNLEKLSN